MRFGIKRRYVYFSKLTSNASASIWLWSQYGALGWPLFLTCCFLCVYVWCVQQPAQKHVRWMPDAMSIPFFSQTFSFSVWQQMPIFSVKVSTWMDCDKYRCNAIYFHTENPFWNKMFDIWSSISGRKSLDAVAAMLIGFFPCKSKLQWSQHKTLSNEASKKKNQLAEISTVTCAMCIRIIVVQC